MSGVQPQEDGRLECLECGRWFRLLPPHLGSAHQMSAAEYREAHQLPRRLGLRASDLAERAREQGRERYAGRPDIRAQMERGRMIAPATSAVRSSQETARRPGVVAARRRGGAGKAAAERARVDEAAHRLGFADVADFLAVRCALGRQVTEMAKELGLPRGTVSGWLHRLRADGGPEQLEQAAAEARRPRQIAYLQALLVPGTTRYGALAAAGISEAAATAWRRADPRFAAAADAIARALADDRQPGTDPVVREGDPGWELVGQALKDDAHRTRHAAYLRELLTRGPLHKHALAAVGIDRSTLSQWRRADPAFDAAVGAVREFHGRKATHIRRGPTAEDQYEAYLAALAQGMSPKEAGAVSGASRFAVRYRAQHDPQFAARLEALRPPGGWQVKPIDEQWLRTVWVDPSISQADIAVQAGVSYPTLLARARELGLGPRRPPRGPEPRPLDEPWLRGAWADPAISTAQIAAQAGLSPAQIHNRARDLGLGKRAARNSG
ncbi:MucR family transcriptional regulator [Kitasatospora sp. NPDC006697]|uniref:MucR family transcriptional regulator n=1 Tax=Kitasatospora sp. NPDC006697 TaxID=3364020 RepID=UPI00368CC8E8